MRAGEQIAGHVIRGRTGRDDRMAGKPTSKRDIDHRALSIERGEIPFDGDDPKHTGVHADTSKLTDEEVQSNPLYWRERIKRARGVAFDDVKKTEWLAAFERTGKIILACDEVGVARQTILRHREKDEEFEAAFDLALERHATSLVNRIEDRAMDGVTNDVYNSKTGDIIGTETKYETALAVKMLGRYDRDYKDRSEVDITSGGKILAIPPTATREEFSGMLERLREQQAKIVKEREEQDAADVAANST